MANTESLVIEYGSYLMPEQALKEVIMGGSHHHHHHRMMSPDQPSE